ncbi:MAG TPA: hypothetical protein VIX18_07725 [Nitrospirota bacterium]
MKKIMILTIAIAAVLTIGAAFAGMVEARGGDLMLNGVTNFSGLSYDTPSDAWNIGPAAAERDVIEGSSAGGLRVGDDEIHAFNGVTNFTGKSYDTTSDAWNIGPMDREVVAKANEVTGSAAGGLREGGMKPYNGVTDFSGKSYDSIPELI